MGNKKKCKITFTLNLVRNVVPTMLDLAAHIYGKKYKHLFRGNSTKTSSEYRAITRLLHKHLALLPNGLAQFVQPILNVVYLCW